MKKRGRKKVPINQAEAAKLCALMCTEIEIANWFGVSHDTLGRRVREWGYETFGAFFEQHSNKSRVSLRREQMRLAMKGNATMLIWLGKQILKQRDRFDELPTAPKQNKIVDFKTFCENAGYPAPYPKQTEMMQFGIEQPGAKLILGARGYGKTDYVVILGAAYSIYLDHSLTYLLVTKSQERNAAILGQISHALRANGVKLESDSTSKVRVLGLHGKDHSVASLTIGSTSIRGRHPKKIIMDDPVTEDDVSEATRKRVQRVYNELTKLTSDILIIGQPVHKFDLYETLRPLLNRIEMPHGTIPELDHDLEAQRLAGVAEESIQASYFLKVISETGFPLENVNFIDDFPPGGSAVAFIDPSFEGGDYTALSIVKAHFDGVAVLGRCYKRAWYNCLDEISEELTRCNVARVCFETNALGDQPVIMLRDLLDGIGVVGKKSTGHKHSRILQAGAFSPLIHIAKTSDRIYIDQTTKYEYGAKNDDAPDSLASALEWIGLIRGK